jgi:cytochrome P450
MGARDFRAPIIEAMETTLPASLIFKHFGFVRKLILSMPPWLSLRVSPRTAGLINIRQILRQQVNEAVKHPESLQDTTHPTIYHQLLSKEANKSGIIPETASLYEEAQALMFGGTDTTGSTLMLGAFHMLENQSLAKRLKEELYVNWPDLDKIPKFEDLQKLPFLVRSFTVYTISADQGQTAVVKESLRISPDVASPLLRVVPASGATIDGAFIPAGVSNSNLMQCYTDHVNRPLWACAEFLFTTPKKSSRML